MPEREREGLRRHQLGGARRHLDVEPQNIVVTYLQRSYAGLGDIPRLERRHELAAVLAQAARFVEIAAIALAHEAAIPTQRRGLIDKGAPNLTGEVAPAAVQAPGDVCKTARQFDGPRAATQQAAAGLCNGQGVTYGRQIARGATLQGEARDGASHVGRHAQGFTYILPQRFPLKEEADGVQPRRDGLRVAQRIGQASGKLARTRARDGSINGAE